MAPIVPSSSIPRRSADLSPDGLWLAVAGADGSVLIRSAVDGRPHPAFGEDRRVISSSPALYEVQFSPGGERLATGGEDGVLRLWPVESKTSAVEFDPPSAISTGEREIYSLQWVDDEHVLVGGRNSVSLWSTTSGERLRGWRVFEGRAVDPVNPVYDLALDRDRGRVAGATGSGAVYVWKLEDGSVLHRFAEHGNQAMAVEFDPLGERLASGSLDRSVCVYRLATDAVEERLSGHQDGVLDVAFSPDGERLASAGMDGKIFVWESRPGMTSYQGHYHMGSLAFSPDGRLLAGGTDSYVVHVWDVERGQGVASLRGHTNRIDALAWLPDGRSLLSSAPDLRILRWSSETWSIEESYPGHERDITGLAVSPDGDAFVSVSWDKTLRMWVTGEPGESEVLLRAPNELQCVAWSPDGGVIAVGGWRGTLLLVDPVSSESTVLPMPENRVTSVGFDARGERLITASLDQVVRIWDVRSRELLHSFEDHTDQLYAADFSPDGRRAASAGYDGVLNVFDALEGDSLVSFRTPERVTALDFSPDGSRIATAGFDGSVSVWETKTATQLRLERSESRALARRMEPAVQGFLGRARSMADALKAVEESSGNSLLEKEELSRQIRFLGDDEQYFASGAQQLALAAERPASEYELALAKIENVLARFPGNADFRAIRGAALTRLGRFEEALESFPDVSSQGLLPINLLGGLVLRARSAIEVGEYDLADRSLPRLKEVALDERWVGNELAESLIAEAIDMFGPVEEW